MTNVVRVHKTLLNLEKRAENKPEEVISSTFVDAEPLLDILRAPTSQIIFGRRGTGKTHALKYCMSEVRESGGIAIFLDIRSIGSNGSYYSDHQVPENERGLRLANDILTALHEELYPVALQRLEEGYSSSPITQRLDDLSESIGNMRILGDVTAIEEMSEHTSTDRNTSGLFEASSTPKLRVSGGRSGNEDRDRSTQIQRSGREARVLDFAQTQASLKGLLEVLNIDRLWLFLDEWSETPRTIQPYLADLIRKTLLPTGRIIVKIAAIEQRSRFIERTSEGYIGLELGADISSDLNLDDFLVFDYDEDRALNFFRELVYKNFLALSDDKSIVESSHELSSLLFTEKRAIEEYTRSVEGVPRDALNIMSKVVTKAYGRKASVDDVRRAALDWYTQDKANAVNASKDLHGALSHIIDEVIGNRRARAFLFPTNLRNEILDRLYDLRVLHLLKKNISSRDEPGRRYDVWKIDYGCYVDLIRTQKAPLGLLPDEADTFIDVPSDDYRSIRRAVLAPEQLDSFLTK